jgi:hypothetical protein
LSFIVTAVPLPTTTDPAVVIVMLSGVPFFTVEVLTGEFCVVVMSVASAGAAIASAAVEASQ